MYFIASSLFGMVAYETNGVPGNGHPRLGGAGGLPDLDEVPVRIADVAADLRSAVLRRGQELGPAGAPLLVDLLDVGHADVQEAAHAIGVARGLERDGGLV